MDPIIFSLLIPLFLGGINAVILTSRKPENKTFFILLLINLSIIYLLVYVTKDFIFIKDQDTWMHLALIRKTGEKGIFPGDPFYKGFPTPPHYSIINPLFFFISYVTGADVAFLWGQTSPVLAVFFFLALFLWAKELFGDKKIALLSSLFATYSLYKAWPNLVTPKYCSLIFYFFTLFYFFRFWRTKNRMAIICTGIFFGLCTATHLFTGLMAAFTLISFFFPCKLFTKISIPKRAFLFIPVGLLISSPWILNTFNQMGRGENLSLTHISLPEIETVFSFFGIPVTILKITFLWNIVPPVVWVFALTGMFFGIRQLQKKISFDALLFLFSGTVFPLLILYTPLYSLAKGFLGVWMLPRLLIVLPLPLWAGYGLIQLLDKIFSASSNKRRWSAYGTTALLIFFFYPIILHQINSIKNSTQTNRKGVPEIADKELTLYADTLLNKTVLSDPYTSYIIPYQTGGYVATMPPGSGSPYINHEKRIEEMQPVMQGEINDDRATALLLKYKVDFLLFNLKAYSGPHGDTGQLAAYQIVQKISFIPSLVLVDQGQKYILFKRVQKKIPAQKKVIRNLKNRPYNRM